MQLSLVAENRSREYYGEQGSLRCHPSLGALSVCTPFLKLPNKVMFGGTNVNRDIQSFTNRTPDILVATPGRLNDHLENSGLAELLSSLQVGSSPEERKPLLS